MKILYVTTISLTMGFFAKHLKMLIEKGHTVELACNCDGSLPKTVEELGLKIHHIPFSRSPLNKTNIAAYKQIKELVKNGNYDIVHTHTPNASAIVRLACKGLRKKGLKVFYTAHGFHFFKGAPLKNWLIYYSVEWLCSFWTDVILTINNEDYNRAEKHFHAKKYAHIPGVGIDLSKFENCSVSKEEKRRELGVPEDAMLLLSVGELNDNKNHEIILRAMANIRNGNLYYYIAGVGNKDDYLNNLASELGISNRVCLLGFRNDVVELCYAADAFCFPSKREGLGLASLEAMACGLPIITSNIHGINDYSVDGVSGYKASPDDVGGFAEAIRKLTEDSEFRIKCGENNKKAVEKFDVKNVLPILEKIYSL